MTSANSRKPFHKDRTEEKKRVLKDFGTVFSQPRTHQDDINLIQMLSKIRSYTHDWRTASKRKQRMDKYSHQSAALLYQRGEELSGDDCCKDCKKGLGVWYKCIAAPIYNNHALYERACSNCRHAGRAAECSLRIYFKADGGSGWVSFDTDRIRDNGGLLAVKEKEERERAEREAQREEERRRQCEEERRRQLEEEFQLARREEDRRRQREEEEERRRAQLERRRRQREREAETEALRRKVPSVVLPSYRESSSEDSEFSDA